MKLNRTLMLLALAAPIAPAQAHGSAHAAPQTGPVKREQTDWGIAGERREARRTVTVTMGDDMRFQPGRIAVRLGETVRFVVHNRGNAMHEFVIGTRDENARHAELMIRFPTMEHDAPHMAHVAPGQRGEIVWTFNRAGEFEFACLIAGHYQAGMLGTIQVSTGADR